MEYLREVIDSLPIGLNALTALMGILVALPIAWRFRKKLNTEKLWKVSFVCLIFLICYYYSTVLFFKFEALFDGMIEENGTSLFGVFYLCVPVLILILHVMKISVKDGLDVFTLCAVPGFFLARFRCLLADCCGGRAIFATQWRWPTRESELIFYAVIFVILWRMAKKNEIPGQLFPLFAMCYGVFRFINEWFRTTNHISTSLHIAHLWALLCAIIGASIYFELKAKRSQAQRTGVKHRR